MAAKSIGKLGITDEAVLKTLLEALEGNDTNE
jgi:hypothetical protein